MRDLGFRLTQLERLFEAFPPVNWDHDADRLLDTYLESIADYDDGDIGAAVLRLLKGKQADYDGRFRPTPPILALACAAVRDARLERLELLRRMEPIVFDEPVPKSPQSRANVREMVDRAVNRLRLVG